MYAHDQIAIKDYIPSLPDIPHEVDEDEESVKVIRLVKGTTEPLVCNTSQSLLSLIFNWETQCKISI